MIWSAAPLLILAVLVAIDWAAGRRRGRPWAYQACACLHPDPETRDTRFASRCRTCHCLWDAWTGAPLDNKEDH